MPRRSATTKGELPPFDGVLDGDELFVGWDQSINHAGVVVLDGQGRLALLLGLVERVADERPGFPALTHIMPDCEPDPDCYDVARLSIVSAWIGEAMGAIRRPAWRDSWRGVLALEDYAYGMARGAHQIGEMGGAVRRQIKRHGWPLRLHDPTSVKLFATGRGDAKKPEVIRAVLERWGVDFTTLHPKVGEDLADAYTLARMALTEYRVRQGVVDLTELTEAERRVFLRTTKARPTNLLDRPFA